jgi:hypothetical protein
MQLLYESPYAVLELDRARRMLRFRRTAAPFPSVEEATAEFRAIAHLTTGIRRAEHVLLTDVRDAHGRNDEAFEAAVGQFRAELFAGFLRSATLVKTVAGKLQVQRLNREQRVGGPAVFQDETEAIAYLETGKLPARRG